MQRKVFVSLLSFAWCAACVERGDVLMPPPDEGPQAGAAGSLAGSAGSAPEAGTAGASGGSMAGSSGVLGGAGGEGGQGEGGTPAPSPLSASEVRAGMLHTCAIYSGRTYCWGANDAGQLGLGDGADTQRLEPTRLPGDHVWRHLALGEAHTCALDDLGRVYCWGSNDHGQLGQGDRTARNTPVLVTLPNRATELSSDFEHTCARLSDFTLYCWGQNYEGQLGQDDPFPGQDSDEADGLSPVQVGDAQWNAVDTGQGHTCGILLDGALYCWGRNSEYELGTEPEGQIRSPTRVGADNDWLDVDAGQHHTCAVREDLSLWCWGQNTGSADAEGFPLGIEGATELAEPSVLEGDQDYALVRTNTFHTCALGRSSELYCWGRNAEGQLGLGNSVPEPTPVLIGSGYAAVSVARFTTCVLTTGGVVQCAGKNDAGELGTGNLDRQNTFTDVIAPTL